jgi:sugar lactone lactonase YvrE
MTVLDHESKAKLFVTNVLNGTVAASPNVVNAGTVLRIELEVPKQGDGKPQRDATTVIGSGFSERTDPAALVVGPTGVGLGHDGTLYVADSVNNRIAGIPDAVNRNTTAFSGNDVTANGDVNDPLGLVIAPNGDILSTNGGDGNVVETTPDGAQVAVRLLDNTAPVPTGGAGTLFGLAVVPGGGGVYFVDDGDNTFRLLAQP